MSTISVPVPRHERVRWECTTRFERLLLRAGSALEGMAVRRMERRAHRGSAPYREHDEARRDATATAHVGLLPR